MGKQWKQWQNLFWGAPKSQQVGDCSHEIKRCLVLGRKVMTNLDSILKSRDVYFADKSPSTQSYGFSGSHGWMWELDHKEGWAAKNWCFQTVLLEKTLESPLNCKEIKSVNPKENQLWIFIGRTGVKAEVPILWPSDVKSWLIGKDPDAQEDWRQEEKGWQRMRLLDGITDALDMSLISSRSWWWTGMPGMLKSVVLQRVGHYWVTELNWIYLCYGQPSCTGWRNSFGRIRVIWKL